MSSHVLNVRPHKNSFSSACLLRFPAPGRHYLVTLQPVLIDSAGDEWTVAPEALFVRTAADKPEKNG